MMGMEGPVTQARLFHTRDWLTPNIGRLNKPTTAVEKIDVKIHAVMLYHLL